MSMFRGISVTDTYPKQPPIPDQFVCLMGRSIQLLISLAPYKSSLNDNILTEYYWLRWYVRGEYMNTKS